MISYFAANAECRTYLKTEHPAIFPLVGGVRQTSVTIPTVGAKLFYSIDEWEIRNEIIT